MAYRCILAMSGRFQRQNFQCGEDHVDTLDKLCRVGLRRAIMEFRCDNDAGANIVLAGFSDLRRDFSGRIVSVFLGEQQRFLSMVSSQIFYLYE